MKKEGNGERRVGLVELDFLHEVSTFFGPIGSQGCMSFGTEDANIQPWGHAGRSKHPHVYVLQTQANVQTYWLRRPSAHSDEASQPAYQTAKQSWCFPSLHGDPSLICSRGAPPGKGRREASSSARSHGIGLCVPAHVLWTDGSHLPQKHWRSSPLF